ncbi:hypothetical protein [Flavobacterium agricola]|uniref:hypothetical protein n=1 Tax=Flavobacterium agricola TaxID=2870839 RepID=UPI00293930CD|nr:hypothetical protein [Flavobacterium agricola]
MNAFPESKKSKVIKLTVCLFLFCLPLLFYVFFASGKNGFTKLPVVTEQIPNIPAWKSLSGDTISLSEKITILGFPGYDLLKEKGNSFNLLQKIYNKNRDFNDFQLVYVLPEGTEADAAQLLKELNPMSDLYRWFFVFAPPAEIAAYYNELELVGDLNEHYFTPNVFIIDKDLNLRGVKATTKKTENHLIKKDIIPFRQQICITK